MNAIIYAGLPAQQQHYVKFGVSVSSPKDILDVCCEVLSQKREDVISKSRKRPIVECRQIAMGLIRLNSSLALTKIGAMFNRDHSTVIYACETFNDLYGRDKKFTKYVDAVKMKTNNLGL